MAQLRLAPEFRVLIDGVPVPSALRASITALSVHTGLDGADRVQMTIVNEGLRWLDHPLLRLDRTVTVSIGYAPDPLTQVFAGEIVTRSATFGSSGVPTLSVAAQAMSHRLQRGTKARWFAIPVPSVGNLPLPDQAIVSLVAAESGLIAEFEPIGAAIAVLLGGAQAVGIGDDPNALQKMIRKQDGESDFAFLARIAAENGWEVLVDHSGPLGGQRLRFVSPFSDLVPVVTLKYGQSLLDFTPRISSVGQIVSVTAIVWLSAIKTQFAITVGWDWDRMALTLEISPSVTPTRRGPSAYLIEEPLTPVTAPRRIVSEFIPRLNKRLTGTGSSVGDPRIAAGAVVRLEGLGTEFGGLYRITSATHTIDTSGFRTSFDVRKEIWFGSIPLSDQGAVPVRVTAPFVN